MLLLRATLTVVAVLVLALPAQADIRRLVVERTETLPDGYQRLTGHAYGELDPKLPLNAIITDIQFAPRNARGMVEYVATFTILKPADMTKASGVLLYLVPNRGRVTWTGRGLIDDARKQGHVLVASGWQSDVQPGEDRETASVPVAKYPDGTSITGRVLARFTEIAATTTTLPILRGGAAGTADPASLDTSKATMTRRAAEGSTVVPLRSDEWAFADCRTAPFPGKPDATMVCVKGGFNPAYLYELAYTAKDPKVQGIGFAATRDLNSYLRYGTQGRDRYAERPRRQDHQGNQPGKLPIGNVPAQLHSPRLQPGRNRAHRLRRQQPEPRGPHDGAEHQIRGSGRTLGICTKQGATAWSGGRTTPTMPEGCRRRGFSIAAV